MKNNPLNDEEAQLALKIVRQNIESYLNDQYYNYGGDLPSIFNEKLGAFVTLNIHGSLRGCIGYSEPYEKLIDALLDVSLAAAFDDPRFYPVSKSEMDEIEIEISVLTKPQEVIVDNYEDYLTKIEIGKDGLIIEKGYNKGLFLPQVPIEQNWDIKEYLMNICYKAGLPSDAWKDEDSILYIFQAQVFSENKKEEGE